MNSELKVNDINKKSREKTISKVLIWYTVSKFLLQGLSFFTIPIFTRLLSPSDYGQMSTYTSWVSLLTIIVGLETSSSISVAYVKIPQKDFKSYLSSIMTISFLSFISFFLLSVIFKNSFALRLGFPPFLIPLMVVCAFFSYCVGFCNNLLMRQRKVELNSLISFAHALFSVGLSLLFVIKAESQKYISKIFAENLVLVMYGLIFFIFIMIRGRCFYNNKYWKFGLSFSLPLILHSACAVIFSQSDRVMLKKMIGESEAGVYSVVYSLALVINVIWMSFNTVWVTYYYDYKSANDKENIKKKSHNYMFVFSILTMGFIFLAPEAYKILAPVEYWSGINYIPLVALAYYFNFLYSFSANYEFYVEKTRVIAFGTMATCLVNIIFNLLLIPRYKGMGAAFATLISFAFTFLIQEFNVRFILKANDFDYSPILYIKGLVPVVVSAAFYYFTMDYAVLRWGIATCLGIWLLFRVVKSKKIL